jgi:hypothetical protein
MRPEDETRDSGDRLLSSGEADSDEEGRLIQQIRQESAGNRARI